MLEKILNLLSFGCRHSRMTKPFYLDRWPHGRAQADRAEDIPRHCSHYVVCLDCGRRFGYDWGEMKVIKAPFYKAG
jgi:hypothetical protein